MDLLKDHNPRGDEKVVEIESGKIGRNKNESFS